MKNLSKSYGFLGLGLCILLSSQSDSLFGTCVRGHTYSKTVDTIILLLIIFMVICFLMSIVCATVKHYEKD